MGYYMNQRAAKFRIPKDKIPLALAAIKALATETAKMGGGSSTGERWFAWVDTEKFVNAKTLSEALGAWRWNCFVNDAGDLVEINFGGEKLGDDVTLLSALAPFVDEGSYIEMEGEEGTLWRWMFKNGELENVNAVITWPE